MPKLTEIGGKRLPFLRWSFVRMLLGIRKLTTEWQVGDGREEALAEYVLANAPQGDLAGVIETIDKFCYEQSFMMNVGDEKGELLDNAIRTADPKLLLELGCYCGYSALRTIRIAADDAHLVSIEFVPANAAIARRIFDHAGIGDRVTVVEGTLGDGGKTIAALEADHGFAAAGSLDFVFLDHDKDQYLPDIQRIVERGWLHEGSVAVADNVKFPGAPEYREYMAAREGTEWRTTEHETHAEYQTLIKDLVLESQYLGGA